MIKDQDLANTQQTPPACVARQHQTPESRITDVEAPNNYVSANANVAHLEETNLLDVTALLTGLVNMVDTLTRLTDERFEALSSGEAQSQRPISEPLSNIQRNLFREPSAYTTPLA
ncbi:unnamed protein product [Cochlearia groenlandica]